MWKYIHARKISFASGKIVNVKQTTGTFEVANWHEILTVFFSLNFKFCASIFNEKGNEYNRTL